MDSFDFKSLIEHLSRWLHILAGIIWIGHLYFFNLVNGPFEGKLDAATKKMVVPELRPRALFWFRWGAAFTWLFGVVLLFLLFYHVKNEAGENKAMFEEDWGWGKGAIILVAVVFLGFFAYDILAKQTFLTKDMRLFALVGFILIGAMAYAMSQKAGFTYRAWVIHTGAMLGTIMAMNVWMRIWPNQKKIITAIKNGTPPDATLVGMAGMRSKHNTYMSVPLLWTMIEYHTGSMNYPKEWGWLVMMGIVLIGWGIVYWAYNKATQLKGF